MGKIRIQKPAQRRHKDATGTTYTRTNRKTGKIYSVKLCNPCKTSTEKQKLTRTGFGILNKAVNLWIKENKEQNTDIYQTVMTKFKRQDRYKLLRGFIIGTNKAILLPDNTVEIRIDSYIYRVPTLPSD